MTTELCNGIKFIEWGKCKHCNNQPEKLNIHHSNKNSDPTDCKIQYCLIQVQYKMWLVSGGTSSAELMIYQAHGLIRLPSDIFHNHSMRSEREHDADKQEEYNDNGL